MKTAVNGDEAAQDRAHSQELLDLLEQEVVALFHERDAAGVPTAWVQMVKRSMTTIGPRFGTTRMLRECLERIYRPA